MLLPNCAYNNFNVSIVGGNLLKIQVNVIERDVIAMGAVRFRGGWISDAAQFEPSSEQD
jgi:hypothetical protein